MSRLYSKNIQMCKSLNISYFVNKYLYKTQLISYVLYLLQYTILGESITDKVNVLLQIKFSNIAENVSRKNK